jgi:hypothetical protein
VVGVPELRAFGADVGGAVEARIAEDAAIGACLFVEGVVVVLDLSGRRGTSCLSLNLSMRTSIIFLCRSSLRSMDFTFACRYISRITKRFYNWRQFRRLRIDYCRNFQSETDWLS